MHARGVITPVSKGFIQLVNLKLVKCSNLYQYSTHSQSQPMTKDRSIIASKLSTLYIFPTVYLFAQSTCFFLLYTVDGCVIPDTIADDVLNSLKSHHDLDELFDVESLLPHMEERLIVTATDKYQIQQLPTQKAKVIALINAVKNKGQKRTKLIQLYASVYDSHERERGHGKHYDTLRILSQAGMGITLGQYCQLVQDETCL